MSRRSAVADDRNKPPPINTERPRTPTHRGESIEGRRPEAGFSRGRSAAKAPVNQTTGTEARKGRQKRRVGNPAAPDGCEQTRAPRVPRIVPSMIRTSSTKLAATPQRAGSVSDGANHPTPMINRSGRRSPSRAELAARRPAGRSRMNRRHFPVAKPTETGHNIGRRRGERKASPTVGARRGPPPVCESDAS